MNFNEGAFIDMVNALNSRQCFSKFCDSVVLNSYEPTFIASNMERYLESKLTPGIEQAILMLQGEECTGTVILDDKVYDANEVALKIANALEGGDSNPMIDLGDGVSLPLLEIASSVREQISATSAAIAAYGSIAAGSSLEYLSTKARSLSIADDGTINDYLNAYSSILVSNTSDLSKLASISQMLESTTVTSDESNGLIIETDAKFGCGSPLKLSSFLQVFSDVADVIAGVLLIAGGIIAKVVGLVYLLTKILLQAAKSYVTDVDDWYLMNTEAEYEKFCYYPIIQQRCTIAQLRTKGGLRHIPTQSYDASIQAYIEFVQSVVTEKKSYCELHNDYHVFLWVDDNDMFNLQVFGNTQTSTSGIIAWLETTEDNGYKCRLVVDGRDTVDSLRQHNVIGGGTMPNNNSDYIRSFGIACALSQFTTDNCFYGYGFGAHPVEFVNDVCDIIDEWQGALRPTTKYIDMVELYRDPAEYSWLTASLLFAGVFNRTAQDTPFWDVYLELGMTTTQCNAKASLVFNRTPPEFAYFDYPTIDAVEISGMFQLSPVDGEGIIINTLLEKWFMLSEIDFMRFLPYSSDPGVRSYGYGLREQSYYDDVGAIAAATITAAAATIVAAAALTRTKVKLNKKANLEGAQVGAAASHVYAMKTQYGVNSPQYAKALKDYDSQVSKAKWYNFLSGRGYSYSGDAAQAVFGSPDVDLQPIISLIK